MAPVRLNDPRERAERAERVLDVAADLLRRWGHRRVTIDEVARHAGIGKGTVYLHWRTREDLLRAVFAREVRAAIGELAAALRADPRAWLPHRLARTYFLAILGRPLLRGLFLRDAELLGRLDDGRIDGHGMVSRAYFGLVARHGVLRSDLSAEAAEHGFLAILEGFIRAAANDSGATTDRADLLAGIVQRAFETGRRVPIATAKAVAADVTDLLAGLTTGGDHA